MKHARLHRRVSEDMELEGEAEELEDEVQQKVAKQTLKGKRKQKLVRGQGVEEMDVDE